MAPPAKLKRRVSNTPEKFKLSSSPFVQDSVKEKVKRWNLVEPEESTVQSSSENSSDRKSKSKESSSNNTKASTQTDEDTDDGDNSEKRDDSQDETHGKPNLQSRKKRPRSKTTGDARVVDWPSTPNRPKSSDKEPQTAPVKVITVTPKTAKQAKNDIDKVVKRASTPRKRVVSDGHWVRVRNPPKKELPPPPEPKPKAVKLANGPAGYAWVRPPLLPRQSSGPEPVKPAPVPEVPQMKTYTGKMRKPIWHQFDVEKERARLEAKDTAIHDAYDFRKAAKWNSPTPKRPGRDSDGDDESSEDTESVLEVKPLKPRSRDVYRSTSNQRSPPQISYKKRRSRPDEAVTDEEESRHSFREAERIPLSSQPRRHSSIQKSPPRAEELTTELPSRYHRRRKSTGSLHDNDQETKSIPLEERRKPSYNAGDVVSNIPDAPPHVPALGIPGRLAAWLTSTPDPFTSTPEKDKTSKPSFSRRLFSFEKDKSESKSPASPSFVDKVREEALNRYSKTRTKETGTSTPTNEPVKKPASATDPEIEVEYASSSSTPTLRRGGAGRTHPSPAHTPIKSPPIENTERDKPSSEVATTVTTSSFVTKTTESSTKSIPANLDDEEPLSPRRPFPSTGKRLSTIVSIETFTTRPNQESKIDPGASEVSENTVREAARIVTKPQRDTLAPSKRKETTLALPVDRYSAMSRAKSVVSVRSTRSVGSRFANTTISDIMKELAADEESFMPELRTLVGGVIKVLIHAVYSKSGATVAASLFSKFHANKDALKEAKSTIHELSVALERLKSFHSRIPTEDPKSFLIWAQGAHKIYAKYVKHWRLGFQDVVISLVPEDDASTLTGKEIDTNSMANALPRNENGYVVNQHGERVDVAFLLKRPLVRLKFLTKSIKALDYLQPTTESEQLARGYQELMDTTKRKVNTERARIEDQRAALTDTRRARDPTSLGALSGVKIDSTRCVRARDFFDMHLLHSTGQEVLSRIEILIRDDPANFGTKGGDILLCQVDDHGKWLFLPPVLLKNVSARRGVAADELIVMIRGIRSGGTEWKELMSLKSGESSVATEWLQMLGTSPIPPAFSRATIVKDSLLIPQTRVVSSRVSSMLSESVISSSTDQREGSRPPSPTATDILPIGERGGRDAKRWGSATPERLGTVSPVTPASSNLSPNEQHNRLGSRGQHSNSAGRKASYIEDPSPEPRDMNEAMDTAGQRLAGLKRTRATRQRHGPVSPTSPDVDNSLSPTAKPRESRQSNVLNKEALKPSAAKERRRSVKSSSQKEYSVWIPPSDSGQNSDEEQDDHMSMISSQLPSLHRRSSSMPLKSNSHARTRRDNDRYSSVSIPSSADSVSQLHDARRYDSLPNSPQKHRDTVDNDTPPPPPPHRTPVSKQSTSNNFAIPQLTPSAISLKRRSSSPLKHEYQPSSESERSVSNDDLSDSYDDDDDFLESSESEAEGDDIGQPVKHVSHAPPEHAAEVEDTITPSQSASQGPFRDVPETKTVFFTTLAGVSQWKNGEYVNLHTQECLIEISAGKVSAFETIPASLPPNIAKKPETDPIVALHLTPGILVQITNVCDVMIRSKPTYDSQFQLKHSGGVHIRFHTRHPSIREAMQDAIGRAQASNPTYLALERARPRETEAEKFERQNPGSAAKAGSKSWWGGSRRTSSFRKTHTRSGSTVGNTENTYRTTSSLKRSINQILAKATGFNIEKSAIFSKTRGNESSGAHTRSLDGEEGPSMATPAPRDAFARDFPNELQHTLRTAQCRVIQMEKNLRSRNARNLGRATLHIMHPPRKPTGSIAGVAGPDGIHEGNGVRVVLANKESILLDHVLPPSCFNHSPRGITIHVFSEEEGGGVRDRGGVGTWAVQEIFLDGFENESMRQWIFDTLTSGRLVAV